jgi:hypothetical protein
MAQDLAEDENTSRSFKARLFGHTPRKDLSRFPQMIAEYGAICKTLAEMEFAGTLRINEAIANLLMIPLTVILERLEASPDCREKTENLAALATIIGQLPVKEGRSNGVAYWGDLN